LTPKQQELWVTPEGLAKYLEKQALPDALVETDIVGGVLFLASSSARMMTGQVMVIDGGVVVTG
jgi:galactose dehydrogenase